MRASVLASICVQVMCGTHVIKLKNLSSCNSAERQLWPSCMSLRSWFCGWKVHLFKWRKDCRSLLKQTTGAEERQREGKQKKKKEISSSKVSLLSQEEGMFLCHCFPFSWQREESQGRACQCESSLKVWRLQLDIASGLTPKDKDNTHPPWKCAKQRIVQTHTQTHTHTPHVFVSLFYMKCMLIPQLFAPHPSSLAGNRQNY